MRQNEGVGRIRHVPFHLVPVQPAVTRIAPLYVAFERRRTQRAGQAGPASARGRQSPPASILASQAIDEVIPGVKSWESKFASSAE